MLQRVGSSRGSMGAQPVSLVVDVDVAAQPGLTRVVPDSNQYRQVRSRTIVTRRKSRRFRNFDRPDNAGRSACIVQAKFNG